MREQEPKVENIRVYQPWSAPVLHFRLSEEQIEDLLEITDLALEDENKKSYNDKLAGEIDSEWEVPDYEDLAEVLDISNLGEKYFQALAAQNHIVIDGENTTMSQHLAVFAQNLEKAVVTAAWFNDQKDNEYNPIHIHQGSLFTGLSSVMILGLPSHYGKEYSAEDKPTNGSLQILGNANGQFAHVDYAPRLKPRDFYVFPYDVRHSVYPFNSTNEVRRTLAANCDVHYNPVNNRGISD